MKKPPFMIGIAGTHSTGKSTFVASVAETLEGRGLSVGQIGDLATKARDAGFPILTDHTYESTLWIIAEGMRQEAEALLTSDVVLVDRPVPDALGYLTAALEVSSREISRERLSELQSIVAAHATRYDLLIITELDHAVPLGPERDTNAAFRLAAGQHVTAVIDQVRPQAVRMTSKNADEVVAGAVEQAVGHFSKGGS
ncbi:AAA family ATPase [Mesorhizobium sp.]|uniref:AAA family ATPase n=1 Tax=Mesorhizobium sp. TaxID=1871066 RepID=UPI0025C02F90|nr:AAA family ATPase [Mesorhizobium sp.]